jgi:ABC-type uncharacterized transport system permease subunit
MPPVFPFTLALYAAACALFLSLLVAGEPGPAAARLSRVARLVLAAAFLSHAIDIGLLCVRGVHPFVSAREVASFVGWLSVGAYLAVTLRYPLPLAGALIVPVTLVLEVAARVGPASSPTHAGTLLATVHIGLATAGIAAFAVAAGDAAVYLFAEGQLKGRGPRRAAPGGLPPLETLDRINHRCIELGFPLFTVAMVTGAIWLMRLHGGGVRWLLQPQYMMAVVAWVLYATLLLLRFVAGWRGRRAALVTLGGFGASLCVILIYYVRGFLGA